MRKKRRCREGGKERERDRQTDRQTDSQTQTDRDKNRDRQRQRQRQTGRDRDRQIDTETDRQRQTGRQTDRQTDRQTGRLTDRDFGVSLPSPDRVLKPIYTHIPFLKRRFHGKTPSTGLRHPSLEEGAGKRYTECGFHGYLSFGLS